MFSSFNCYSCCRLCLQSNECITIDCVVFEELNAAIKNVFGFEISIKDKCSTKICRECSRKVSSISMYKDTVLNNQKTIEQYQTLQSKLLTYPTKIKPEGTDDSDDIIFVSETEQPKQEVEATNIAVQIQEPKKVTEEYIKNTARKSTTKSSLHTSLNIDCPYKRRKSVESICSSTSSVEVISPEPTPLNHVQEYAEILSKIVQVSCKVITEKDVEKVYLSKRDRKILNVHGKRKEKHSREEISANSVEKPATDKLHSNQNNSVVTAKPPIRLSLNELKRKIDDSFRKGKRKNIPAENMSTLHESNNSNTSNINDSQGVRPTTIRKDVTSSDKHKTMQNMSPESKQNMKVQNTTFTVETPQISTNVSSRSIRKQHHTISSLQNIMPVIPYNCGHQTSSTSTGFQTSISVANSTISKPNLTMSNSNTVLPDWNSHRPFAASSVSTSKEPIVSTPNSIMSNSNPKPQTNRTNTNVNSTISTVTNSNSAVTNSNFIRHDTNRKIPNINLVNATMSSSNPTVSNQNFMRQEANRNIPIATTITAMSNSNSAVTNANLIRQDLDRRNSNLSSGVSSNLYSAISTQNFSTLNSNYTQSHSNSTMQTTKPNTPNSTHIRLSTNPPVLLTTVASNNNTKLANIYPTAKSNQNPVYRLQVPPTGNVNERIEQNHSSVTSPIQPIEISKDTSQAKTLIPMQEYIPLEQFFVRQTSTNNPNRINDPKVKVLSVNELNLRADVTSDKDSVEQKLPIRITLVKVRSELQIKLTDSKNNDITFKNLSTLEQQAVRTSLLQPTSKAQIIAAIKVCGLDQYSRNLLNFLGLSSLIPNSNYHQK